MFPGHVGGEDAVLQQFTCTCCLFDTRIEVFASGVETSIGTLPGCIPGFLSGRESLAPTGQWSRVIERCTSHTVCEISCFPGSTGTHIGGVSIASCGSDITRAVSTDPLSIQAVIRVEGDCWCLSGLCFSIYCCEVCEMCGAYCLMQPFCAWQPECCGSGPFSRRLSFLKRQPWRIEQRRQRPEQRLWHGKPLPSSPQRLRRPPTRRRGQVRCSRRRQEQRHRPGLKPGGGRRGSGSLAAGSGSPGAGGGPPRDSNRGTCEDGGSSSARGRCSSGL